jgi:CRISPR-associated protein Cas1
VVYSKGKKVEDYSSRLVKKIVISGDGISISSNAIALANKKQIPIFFISKIGQPESMIYPTDIGRTVVTRRKQFEALTNSKGVELSKKFVYGKLTNQANQLRYLAKSRKNNDLLINNAKIILERREDLLKIRARKIENVRNEIMTLESNCAKPYWEALATVIPEEYNFKERIKKNPPDSFNTMINYGYGMLKTLVWSNLYLAGLDPYAGFLHVDRPGRLSLVFDLIEEFRPLVDRESLTLLTKKMWKLDKHFKDGFTFIGRKFYIAYITKSFTKKWKFNQRMVEIDKIILAQARNIAKYLRGELGSYEPFILSW